MAVTAPRKRSGALPLKTWSVKGQSSAINGLAAVAPDEVLTNSDLERMVETSDQWIVERTGIRSRHVAPPGTTTTSLAVAAARLALERAEVKATDLDLILVATSSPDGPFPSIACRVQEQLDAPGVAACDLLAACSGFVYGLASAHAHIQAGMAERVLVIGAEVLSRLIDWGDRGTCVLFGDGAGAAVVSAAPEGAGFRSWCLGADGRGHALIGYGNLQSGAYAAPDPASYISMQGPDVFKFAVDIFIRQAEAVAAEAGISMDDIDLWVPHQANGRIIEAAARRVGLPMERVVINIDGYGNTSTASIPLALQDALDAGRIRPGDKVLIAGFGSGLTWGSCLLEWV